MVAPWVCIWEPALEEHAHQRGTLNERGEYTQELPPILATRERRGLSTVEGLTRVVEGLNTQLPPFENALRVILRRASWQPTGGMRWFQQQPP